MKKIAKMFFLLSLFLLGMFFIIGCSSDLTNNNDVSPRPYPGCNNNCSNISVAATYLESKFGLEKNSYQIQCMECVNGRGGYVKAKIVKDDVPIDIYYHWGWCSSGGTDCGWDICISEEYASESLFYSSAKSRVCSTLASNQLNDGTICMLEAYDDSENIRTECMDGVYEYFTAEKHTFSIVQLSNRCKNSVVFGKADCLEN